MQSISVFLDIAKFADFQWKIADVRRTEGACHVICIYFASSLGRVLMCQVSLLYGMCEHKCHKFTLTFSLNSL